MLATIASNAASSLVSLHFLTHGTGNMSKNFSLMIRTTNLMPRKFYTRNILTRTFPDLRYVRSTYCAYTVLMHVMPMACEGEAVTFCGSFPIVFSGSPYSSDYMYMYVSQTNPTPECEVNGTTCCGG